MTTRMSALIRINYQSIRDKEQQNYSKIILKIGEEVNGNEVMIGRDNDCNISINSIEISRKHAIIKYVKSDKNWIITDLQSTNGLFINGNKLSAFTPYSLREGDNISFGPLSHSNFCYVFVDNYLSNELSNNGFNSMRDSSEVTSIRSQSLSSNDQNSSPTNSLTTNGSDCSLRNSSESNAQTITSSTSNQSIDCHKQKKFNRLRLKMEIKQKERQLKTKLEELTQIEREINIKKRFEEIEKLKRKLSKERKQSAEEKSKQNKLLEEKKEIKEIIDSELSCSICHELFVSAVILNCSHTFCSNCIERWKQSNGGNRECPVCRQEITHQNRALVVDNLIENLRNKIRSH